MLNVVFLIIFGDVIILSLKIKRVVMDTNTGVGVGD